MGASAISTPAWNPHIPTDRVYEEKLRAYCGRTPYRAWQNRNANS